MKITVEIPKNDYVQPTQVRQEVVQGICEAFLDGCIWSVFHPFKESVYRRKTDSIVRHRGEKKFYGFHNSDDKWSGTEYIRFNGEEMKSAFNALLSAGYYMFRVYTYGTWMGYKCSKKPYLQDGERVEAFGDFID